MFEDPKKNQNQNDKGSAGGQASQDATEAGSLDYGGAEQSDTDTIE